VAAGTIQTSRRVRRGAGHVMRLYCVVNSSHSTPIGATPRYWALAMKMRVSRSSISVCIALVKLHHATASIIHAKAPPPGTPRRVRAMTIAQVERAVDASSAAA
jgi:hypothetical protein